MGLFRRFIAVITCGSCTTVDEKALEERNKLRKKLGKNKILPQAQTSIDIKTKQVQSKPKESPDSWDIFTVEKKREEIIVDGEEIIGDEGKVEGDGDKIVGDGEKAGGDAAMYEFALHYVKTLVIPGAMERYRVEQDREKTNVSVATVSMASLGGFSDISMSVFDSSEFLDQRAEPSETGIDVER